MAEYIYEYRAENGQTLHGVFTDSPSLDLAKQRCQELADKNGTRVTLYETHTVRTMVERFDATEVTDGC